MHHAYPSRPGRAVARADYPRQEPHAAYIGQRLYHLVSALVSDDPAAPWALRRARAEPDRYRNLAVRVSGSSQRFCLLSKDLQDHIIVRTKHGRVWIRHLPLRRPRPA